MRFCLRNASQVDKAIELLTDLRSACSIWFGRVRSGLQVLMDFFIVDLQRKKKSFGGKGNFKDLYQQEMKCNKYWIEYWTKRVYEKSSLAEIKLK